MDALLILSSKGQLVIPAHLRQLLGLRPGDRLALRLEPDGLHLVPLGPANAASAQALIGAAHDQGETVPLDPMDPTFLGLQACLGSSRCRPGIPAYDRVSPLPPAPGRCRL